MAKKRLLLAGAAGLVAVAGLAITLAGQRDPDEPADIAPRVAGAMDKPDALGSFYCQEAAWQPESVDYRPGAYEAGTEMRITDYQSIVRLTNGGDRYVLLFYRLQAGWCLGGFEHCVPPAPGLPPRMTAGYGECLLLYPDLEST